MVCLMTQFTRSCIRSWPIQEVSPLGAQASLPEAEGEEGGAGPEFIAAVHRHSMSYIGTIVKIDLSPADFFLFPKVKETLAGNTIAADSVKNA